MYMTRMITMRITMVTGTTEKHHGKEKVTEDIRKDTILSEIDANMHMIIEIEDIMTKLKIMEGVEEIIEKTIETIIVEVIKSK